MQTNYSRHRAAVPNILAIALESKIADLKIANPHTPWCNGNTAPFGGVILGSNPSGVAKPNSL